MNELTITTTGTFQMKTGRRQFPITLGLSEIIDRKEIMKEVNNELEKKGKYKPELTIYERIKLGKKLIKASEKEDLEEVKELLNKGADTNVKMNEWTALHHAVDKNNWEIIELLICYNADLNIKDNCGWTPLRIAFFNKNIKLVNFLINNGAKVNIKDNENTTILDDAKKENHKEVIELLESKGAK